MFHTLPTYFKRNNDGFPAQAFRNDIERDKNSSQKNKQTTTDKMNTKDVRSRKTMNNRCEHNGYKTRHALVRLSYIVDDTKTTVPYYGIALAQK